MKARLMGMTNDEIDIIQVENDLTDMGIDLMSAEILSMTPEELANMAIEKEKEAKERARLEREERKRKEEQKRRLKLLSETEAYNEYTKLMMEFSNFDLVDPNTHWTANLVRVMNAIKYKHSVDTLANPHTVIGDIESISNLAIVKSHLSLAVFDSIWNQMNEFVIHNPVFNLADEPLEKVAVSYADGSGHKLDETAETSSDPNWGMW